MASAMAVFVAVVTAACLDIVTIIIYYMLELRFVDGILKSWVAAIDRLSHAQRMVALL